MKKLKLITACCFILMTIISCQKKEQEKAEHIDSLTEEISHIEPIINDVVLNELSQAYGFKIGQDYSLEMIKNEYPSLAPQIQLAKLKFAKSFESSLETIDSIMLTKGNEWINVKNQIKDQIKASFKLRNYNYNQILDFISTVENRANGEIPTPIIGTLLTFNPRYLKDPALEFTDGFKHRFKSEGNEKAKGVNYHLDLPKSWVSKEPNRPNIVHKFVSQNGHGFEAVMVLVLPLLNESGLSEEQVKELAQTDGIKDWLPTNAQFINGGFIKIDNLPGFYQEYKITMIQIDKEITIHSINYNVYYKNKMISIQCSVGGTKEEEKKTDSVFEKYKRLFNLVAGSLVVENQWKE